MFPGCALSARAQPASGNPTLRASGRAGIARTGALLGAGIWRAMNFIALPMTRVHAAPVASLPFAISLVQHVVVVGPLMVATLH